MIIIYHSRDIDGFCSAAIAKLKYPDATLIGYDYGQPIPWDKIPEMESVIILDVSLPMVDMAKLLDYSGDLTWIDHHASAISDYHNFIWPDYAETRFKAVLEDGIAACEGAWKYFFPHEPIPMAVQLLGEYDTWRNKDKKRWDNEIIPFQFGMRLDVNSAERFPMHLLKNANSINDANTLNYLIKQVMETGDTIVTYQKSQNMIAMKGAFEVDFFGHLAIACNGGGFNSQAFESIYKPDIHDIMMPFKYNGKFWNFSLYTDKEDVDCSTLAKRMGGGGHKKAAGFQSETIPEFLNFKI